MQNKGVIRSFAILMAIVCAFQLSFSIKTYLIKKEAKEFALEKLDPKFQSDDLDGDSFYKRDSLLRTFENKYLDSLSGEIVYNIGLAQYSLRECQEREINLGLDLQGGMNVILEVSVEDIITALSNYNRDTAFVKALELAKEMRKKENDDFVDIFGRAFEQVNPNGKLSAIFATMELKPRVTYNSTNDQVLEVLRAETESAIKNAFEILRARIDKFGVAQPKIQRLETQGRILVELPGVKDQTRVRKLLQSTANLEFWETYNIANVYEALINANKVIKNAQDVQKSISGQEQSTKGVNESMDVLLDELNNSQDEEVATEDKALEVLDQITQEESGQESDTLTDTGLENYPLFAIFVPAVNNDGTASAGSQVGFARAKDTAKVGEYLRMPAVRALFPRDIRFLWDAYPIKDRETNKFTDTYNLHAIKVTGRDGLPALSGDVVTSATADFDQASGRSEVSMNMNKEGTRIWGRLTKDNLNKSIAVVLDNYVYSSPVVETEITNGRSRITGSFNNKEAQDLANMLKSGKLPAPARIIQDNIVGPSLGKESINKGMKSFLFAFMLVLLFMIIWYSRKAGSVANIALLVNMYFIAGVLASMGAALTLPGIAGIVLTIGMSVDANVLIYERIREELAAGKGLKLAVADGYKNANSAIIDANVTTLLTGVILYLFGTGPIKGFATTLVIGILTSLFTAIFITRLIFLKMMDKNKELSFATKLTEGAFKKVNIDFIGKRKIFYAISALIILGGVFSLATRKLNLGVDFKGGRTYLVRFDQEKVDNVEIQNNLKAVFGETPEVVTFGSENQVRIVTKAMIDDNSAEVDDRIEEMLYNGLKPLLGDVSMEGFLNDNLQSSQKVGPTIADDIRVQAMWSIVFALIFMFLYIVIRFKNWQFGLGAVLALVHDVTIVLGLFSIFYGILPFSLEIDQAFIAAILTVVGYSLNDTVVVFDRIRENIALHPKRETTEIMNLSLNGTLSRTFNTSLTTFIVLLTIFIFGGEVIRGFTFALLVGVLVGTYSSLFVASPIVYDTIRKVSGKQALSGKRKS